MSELNSDKLDPYVKLYADQFILHKKEAHQKAMNDVVIQFAADRNLEWSSIEVNNFIHEMYKDVRFNRWMNK